MVQHIPEHGVATSKGHAARMGTPLVSYRAIWDTQTHTVTFKNFKKELDKMQGTIALSMNNPNIWIARSANVG
jgi:hypothetical protein